VSTFYVVDWATRDCSSNFDSAERAVLYARHMAGPPDLVFVAEPAFDGASAHVVLRSEDGRFNVVKNMGKGNAG
jgi:hypothetical protein